MKKLFFLYVLLGLWVVSFGNEHEHVGPLPISESDGVVLLTFLGDKLPLTFLWSMVDHPDIEVMSMPPVDEPNAYIGTLLVYVNNTNFAINTLCDGPGKVGPIVSDDGNSLVLKMEHGPILGEIVCRCPQNDNEYKKHPFHDANITKI